MSKAGKRILEGLEEALRYTRGEETDARVTVIETPDVPAIRKKLGFTQQEFAESFGVSLGTLRNWEQGARLPEGPARVLLQVIDREPAAVKRALTQQSLSRAKTSAKTTKKRKRA
jgi:putative transcriptional regulator